MQLLITISEDRLDQWSGIAATAALDRRIAGLFTTGENRGAICRLSLFVEIGIFDNFRQNRITRFSRSVTRDAVVTG